MEAIGPRQDLLVGQLRQAANIPDATPAAQQLG
jgi:hypothetical protein